MAEKVKCPACGSGNVYVLVGGKIICRSCLYDGRKVKKEVTKNAP